MKLSLGNAFRCAHTSIHLCIFYLKSYRSLSWVNYKALCFWNTLYSFLTTIIFLYCTVTCIYICLLLYNYNSLRRASSNAQNVLIELWLNCFNLSTALHSNYQNNFLGFCGPELNSIKDIGHLFRDTYWLEFVNGRKSQNTANQIQHIIIMTLSVHVYKCK